MLAVLSLLHSSRSWSWCFPLVCLMLARVITMGSCQCCQQASCIALLGRDCDGARWGSASMGPRWPLWPFASECSVPLVLSVLTASPELLVSSRHRRLAFPDMAGPLAPGLWDLASLQKPPVVSPWYCCCVCFHIYRNSGLMMAQLHSLCLLLKMAVRSGEEKTA